MRTNVPVMQPRPTTHEGAPAALHVTPYQQLRRSVMSCLLWEDEFYEDGQSIAARIDALAEQVSVEQLAALAIEARTKFNLRHAPLWLLLPLIRRARGYSIVSETIATVIQRVDEMPELLAMYWKGGRKPIAKQLQKGLALAMGKFDEYQLAKYDRDGAVKLRDVLFLSHAKPKGDEREALYKRITDRTLATPDTWEVALSGGADKKETFERLLREGNLGYLALLRNLRNMVEAGVDETLVRDAIMARKNGARRVLPFRYVAAARAAPRFEPALDIALQAAISEMEPLPGKTAVMVDVSGSMILRLSGKSDLSRIDAAAALAAIIPGDLRVFSFSERLVEVPPRRGMAGVDAVIRSQPHGETYLGRSLTQLYTTGRYDRIIIITDEQSHDPVVTKGSTPVYLINVASARNWVGYGGRFVHIDGFSEQVLRFIVEYERGWGLDTRYGVMDKHNG